MSKIGPYSRPHVLAEIDGRTKEARLVRETRAELLQHVGGSPSATQRLLIEQAVQLRLHLAMIDRKVAEGGGLTPHDSRTYLSWANSLNRILRTIGMKETKGSAPARSLADHLAGRAAS